MHIQFVNGDNFLRQLFTTSQMYQRCQIYLDPFFQKATFQKGKNGGGMNCMVSLHLWSGEGVAWIDVIDRGVSEKLIIQVGGI